MARTAQRTRYAKMPGDVWNGRVPGRWLDRHGDFASDAREFLSTVADRMGVSARGYHRILRVARTIADLDGEIVIQSRHVAEAVRYRSPGTLAATS